MPAILLLLGIPLTVIGVMTAVVLHEVPDVWFRMLRSNHWERYEFLTDTPWEYWAIAGGVGVVMLVASMVMRSGEPKMVIPRSIAFGSARWSSTEEMRQALFQMQRKLKRSWDLAWLIGRSVAPQPQRTDGVVLCQEDSAVLHPEPGINGRPMWIVDHEAPLVRVSGYHVLIEAKTGAGKGQGPLLATLLTDRRSVVALDPKSDEEDGGELYKYSAGFRDTFSVVRRFAPTEYGWHRFNPLLEIPLGKDKDHPHPLEGKEAYRIANVLTGSGAKEDTDSRIYWKSAEVLLTCAILDRLWHGKGPDRSLPGVFRLLSARGVDVEKIRDAIVERSPRSARHHADRLSKIDAKKGILQGAFDTVLDVLSYCGDDTIASNLEASDFRLSDLSQGERPMTLYLAFPFADADILKPLARLMTNMLIASHLKTPRYRQQTVYLLDEFDDLGYLPALEKAVTKIRGYGVQLVLVTQTRQQIYAIYEHKADVILDNLAVQLVWGVSGRNAAQKIAEGLGKRTVSEEMVSRGTSRRGFFDPTTNSENRAIKEHGRDLMTADEVTSQVGCDCILFGPEMRPYLGKSVVCYSMPAFQERSAKLAPGKPYWRAA